MKDGELVVTNWLSWLSRI